MLAFKSFVILASIGISVSAKAHRGVRRQNPTLPKCALNCLVAANFDTCAATDNACLCKSSAFVSGLTSCINSGCAGADLTSAQTDITAICQAVGVTIPPPSNNGTSTLSSCATTCLANANFGSCGPADNACLCQSSTFIPSVSSCVQSNCTATDVTSTAAEVASICQSVGVTPPSSPPSSGNSTLPACATKCLANANLGNCSASDNACLCQNNLFVNSFGACIENSCNSSDYNSAQGDFKALCAAVGVTSPAAGQLPTCAATCIAKANLGGCAATDNACLCKSSTFVKSTESCFKSGCSAPDLSVAQADVTAICQAVGVNLTSF